MNFLDQIIFVFFRRLFGGTKENIKKKQIKFRGICPDCKQVIPEGVKNCPICYTEIPFSYWNIKEENIKKKPVEKNYWKNNLKKKEILDKEANFICPFCKSNVPDSEAENAPFANLK